MERSRPIDIDRALAETVSAVYDLVQSQIGTPTPQSLQEGRIASERIDTCYHVLRAVLSPSQIIGMVAREILLKKDKTAEANSQIRHDLKNIQDAVVTEEDSIE